MSQFTSQILPALEAFGIWAYWLIGLASLLEGWWLTGLIVPGTLIVDAGGVLVRLGHLDFVDLAWFVALGALLGGELSWHSGRWLKGHMRPPTAPAFVRAQDLLRRRGGLSLVIGRFLGPVAGFVPLAAALAGMERGRFVRWNIASGVIYALAHLAVGYAAGDIAARLGPYLPRLILPLALVAGLILLTWVVTRQLRRGLPLLLAGGAAIRAHVVAWPPMARLVSRMAARHPRAARFVAARLNPQRGRGLLTTAVAALVLYLVAVFADGALELTMVPDAVALDQRVANLAHAYWLPAGLTLAGWFTQMGHVPVATLVALGAVSGLYAFGRRASAMGLAVAVVGNAATVTLLKLAFGRARPELSYFLETSHSFPSGHAAISVALYGTLALMLWRERLIGPSTAIVAGVFMAGGLGLTRIYLVEHFLSDVLNGWIVGAIWLVIGAALAEGLRVRRDTGVVRHPAVGAMCLLACIGGATWFAVNDMKDPVERGAVPSVVVADPLTSVGSSDVPTEIVTLDGDRLPPVSLLTLGAAPQDVSAALTAQGWAVVPEPGLWSVVAALRADLTDSQRTTATVLPAFRAAQPAAVTLRDAGGDVVRLWSAGVDAIGRPIVALGFAPDGAAPDWQPAAARTQVLQALGGQQTVIKAAAAKGDGWSFDGATVVLDLAG